MYRSLIRPILFRLPPESAHQVTLRLIGFAGKILPLRKMLRAFFLPLKSQPVQLFGLSFPNQVGLAAGYDKDAEAYMGLSMLGFGHIEVGTITPQPQSGNPKPRVFRLLEDNAVINRMGFPGKGTDYCYQRLENHLMNNTILGINIGKNKDTPLSNAGDDYAFLIEKLSNFADYFTINISSPNTVGLRQLQHRAYLEDLLAQIIQVRDLNSQKHQKSIPLLVKISPDMPFQELDRTLDVIMRSDVQGIVATNTTTSRENLKSSLAHESGGLSGPPLRQLSTRVIAHIHQQTGGKIPIIGVGGITSPHDAQEKFDAGASLVQIYTGLIYQGPRLVRKIIEETSPTTVK